MEAEATFYKDTEAKQLSFRIWADQDAKISRIMMQVGADRPVCILKYDREMVNMVSDEVVAVEFTKTPESPFFSSSCW